MKESNGVIVALKKYALEESARTRERNKQHKAMQDARLAPCPDPDPSVGAHDFAQLADDDLKRFGSNDILGDGFTTPLTDDGPSSRPFRDPIPNSLPT